MLHPLLKLTLISGAASICFPDSRSPLLPSSILWFSDTAAVDMGAEVRNYLCVIFESAIIAHKP